MRAEQRRSQCNGHWFFSDGETLIFTKISQLTRRDLWTYWARWSQCYGWHVECEKEMNCLVAVHEEVHILLIKAKDTSLTLRWHLYPGLFSNRSRAWERMTRIKNVGCGRMLCVSLCWFVNLCTNTMWDWHCETALKTGSFFEISSCSGITFWDCSCSNGSFLLILTLCSMWPSQKYCRCHLHFGLLVRTEEEHDALQIEAFHTFPDSAMICTLNPRKVGRDWWYNRELTRSCETVGDLLMDDCKLDFAKALAQNFRSTNFLKLGAHQRHLWRLRVRNV